MSDSNMWSKSFENSLRNTINCKTNVYSDDLEKLSESSEIQSKIIKEQVEHLQNISENLDKQVQLALKESERAKREAVFAKTISVLSILVSLIALFN